MTLFGYDLDGQQIAALVSLLAVLALWLVVLGRERGYARWFRQWEADRKARRDAELAQHGQGPKRGPWG
ncbi:hypothetical protein [Brevundimonas sp.]|uniref:hypothetical protein n=1 Tax=Brevundimonas sp. TaxID=1871086 RepID=UPI002ED8A838